MQKQNGKLMWELLQKSTQEYKVGFYYRTCMQLLADNYCPVDKIATQDCPDPISEIGVN